MRERQRSYWLKPEIKWKSNLQAAAAALITQALNIVHRRSRCERASVEKVRAAKHTMPMQSEIDVKITR